MYMQPKSIAQSGTLGMSYITSFICTIHFG